MRPHYDLDQMLGGLSHENVNVAEENFRGGVFFLYPRGGVYAGGSI